MNRFAALCLLAAALAACTWTEPLPSQSIRVDVLAQGSPVRDVACRLNNDRGTWALTAPGSVTILESMNPLTVDCRKSGQPSGSVRVNAEPSGYWERYTMAGGARALTDPRGFAPRRYPARIEVVLGATTPN